VKSAGGRGHGRGRPWAVLVTGVNGIRKTTSVHQPWFSSVLREALVRPSSCASTSTATDDDARPPPGEEEGALPDGGNSFFRQLDHMIATLCNEDFSALYALVGALLGNDDDDDDRRTTTTTTGGDDDVKTTTTTGVGVGYDPPPVPSRDLMTRYSDLKGGIFARYRTLSELLGAILMREARYAGVNVMCETSGRDAAMFRYVDHFFPPGDGGYNRLALRFTIDDLGHAMRSVDARMARGLVLILAGPILYIFNFFNINSYMEKKPTAF